MPTFATYRRDMRRAMAEDYPVVGHDSDALMLPRMLAEHRLPGLLVTAGAGNSMRYPASQVVRFIVPPLGVQDDPTGPVSNE